MVTEERFYVGSRRSLMAEVWPATLFTSKYSPLLFSKGRFFKRAREEEGGRGREKNRQRTKRKKTRGGSECLAVCRIWVSDLGPWRLVAWSAGNLFSRPSPPSISLSPSLLPSAPRIIFSVHRSPRPLRPRRTPQTLENRASGPRSFSRHCRLEFVEFRWRGEGKRGRRKGR